MIDFAKEISNYGFIDNKIIDKNEMEEPIFGFIQMLSNDIRRLTKEQVANSAQFEEILNVLDSVKEDTEITIANNKDQDKFREDKLKIQKSIISACDLVENLYWWAKSNKGNQLSQQIITMWYAVGEIFMLSGISRIEETGIKFNAQIHHTVKTSSVPDIDHGVVIEVLKTGYLVDGQVFRKAHILLNTLSDNI